MACGRVGDRVVVVGRDGAAHAHRADDPPVLHQRDRASAEDESIVAERRNVVGEELALAEPLFEVAPSIWSQTIR